MKITVNGQTLNIQACLSIAEFIAQKGLNPDSVVVEHNYQIIPQANWSLVTLQPDDHLEIVTFVGGG